MILKLFLLYLGSYLCGAIPFGVIFARAKGIDLMKVGSGNIGATNVKRALGTRLALVVFCLDVAKSAVPCCIARLVITHPLHSIPAQVFWFVAGLMAIAGHCFSPFLRFKGGKGVSTALGMVIGSAPLVAASSMTLFVLLLLSTRYMSLASVVAIAAATVFGWILPGQARELVPLYLLLTVFVAYRHQKNISRLIDGTEPRFSFRKDPPSPDGEDKSSDDGSSEPQKPAENDEVQNELPSDDGNPP